MKNILLFILITIIPISVFSQGNDKKVLLLGTGSVDGWFEDVTTKIESSNEFNVVNSINITEENPTREELNSYDAVLFWIDNTYFLKDTLVDRLTSFVNSGKGLVNMCFSAGFLAPETENGIGGSFTDVDVYTGATFTTIQAGSENQDTPAIDPLTFTNLENNNHAIFSNIDSINFGTFSFHQINGDILNNSVVLANYDNNNIPLVIINDNIGDNNAKRAFLNFLPISNDPIDSDGFWESSTDGVQLITNSLHWVMNSEIPSENDTPLCFPRALRNNFEWIDNIKIGVDIDNHSGRNTTTYADYTDQIAYIEPNSSIEITLTPGYRQRAYREYWRVWADWNNNGQFEENEVVLEKIGKGEQTGNISIPSNFDSSNIVLRVSMSWKNFTPHCGSFRSGEIEDYSLNLNAE